MHNRYLVVFLMIVVALLGLFGGCTTETHEPDTQSAPNDSQQTPQAVAQPPQVFELDVEKVLGKGSFIGHPEVEECQTLRFQLAVGDRVEGVVTTNNSAIISSVTDPYRNIVVGSARRTVNLETGFQKSVQKYPWGFAFTADTSGEFSLEVDTDWADYQTPPNAHLKVIVYKK